MKKKIYISIKNILFLVIINSATSPAYAFAQKNRDTLYQISTINALLSGLFDGDVPVEKLKKNGDFGIGTFNALDGEMLVLDGKVYRIDSTGSVNLVSGKNQTPFAAVTFFEADKTIDIMEIPNIEKLYQLLDNSISEKNIFQAVKIKGFFTYVKTRTPSKQSKPYKKLAEALKDQHTFEFKAVKGTLVGLRSPGYVNGINVPGYHFHFIADDKKSGGHLLECGIQKATIEIDDTTEFHMVLSKSPEFNSTNLVTDRREELNKAEK